MKKAMILGVFASMLMVSCSKNYTCKCVTTESVSGSSNTELITIAGSKKDAKAACTALSQTVSTLSKVCEIQ